MTAVVYNMHAGIYSLSQITLEWLDRKGVTTGMNTPRDHPDLVEAVKVLGEKAGGPYSSLGIAWVETPWIIYDIDGQERVYSRKKLMGYHGASRLLD